MIRLKDTIAVMLLLLFFIGISAFRWRTEGTMAGLFMLAILPVSMLLAWWDGENPL